VVVRPRLLEKLDHGLADEHRLTLMSAPAGCGKTTLLNTWLAERQAAAQAAWLSLDEQDNDPVRFWTYVIAALQSTWPGLGQGALDSLQSPQPPPVPTLLPDLLNEIGLLTGPAILTTAQPQAHATTATPQIGSHASRRGKSAAKDRDAAVHG